MSFVSFVLHWSWEWGEGVGVSDGPLGPEGVKGSTLLHWVYGGRW